MGIFKGMDDSIQHACCTLIDASVLQIRTMLNMYKINILILIYMFL